MKRVYGALVVGLGMSIGAAWGQQVSVRRTPARVRQAIDENERVTLQGQVRGGLAQHRDLGAVEDSLPLRLFLVLKPSSAQQADLDGFLTRQQDPASADYHKWLTPTEYGARFGLASEDTGKIARWLESRGFTVKSVLNNGSMIDFEATAGRVRDSFGTPMRYYEVNGGRYPANSQEPSIPAALGEVVSSIQGLDRFPLTPHHSVPRLAKEDATSHRLSEVSPAAEGRALQPAAIIPSNTYVRYVGAQDFYTIYNVKPTFAGGNLGAGATIAVVEQSDMVFGTVDPVTGVATGGDVANFRSTFAVPGKLNMVVMHGAGSVTCNAPGISTDEFEATLDAEWANAAAPSARLLYMSCDTGIIGSLAALVDNNLGDVLSISYGASELFVSHPIDGLYQQAAAQGQSIIVSSGDSGSDAAEQNATHAATYPISVNVLAASPLVTALGGTDFADDYDYNYSSLINSRTYTYTNYWATTNQPGYGTALGYIPETVWNGTCANSLYAHFYGDTISKYCGDTFQSGTTYLLGGGGGFSTQYNQPGWQAGIAGLSSSATTRSVPDVSLFSSSGFWRRALLVCDTTDSGSCVSGNFNAGGGTSFAAPQFAGITGLIVAATGSRQGVLNPNLYALARAQYAAAGTATACYANGQATNDGVTTGLPAAGCVFNDVTTGNNDVPCLAGHSYCYSDPGKTYGVLSTIGAASTGPLSAAYSAGPGYDSATGLGSVNVSNLVAQWTQGFSSTATLAVSPATISTAQSTTLTATVTGANPAGFSGPAPSLSGTVNFSAASVAMGSCTLASGSCSLVVSGASLQTGANTLVATFVSSAYLSSTSNAVTVTVTPVSATLTSPAPGSQLAGSTVTFGWNPGLGNSNYEVYAGSSPGGYDIYSGNPVYGVTSLTLSGFPTDGRTVYVRLWSRNGGGTWQYNDYAYTASLAVAVPATMTTPASGSQLTGSTVTFAWNPGTRTTNYEIYAGSNPGGYDIYSGNPVYGVTSLTLSGFPTDGRNVYVRLWSRNGEAPWQFNDYAYTTAAAAAVVATMTSPAPGAQLAGSKVTFGWNPGTGTTNYVIYAGSIPGGYDIYSGNPVYGVTSLTLSGFPTDGRRVYVRLWSRNGGAPWQYSDSVYTASTAAVVAATLTSPAPGSQLAGSTVTFGWTLGTGTTTCEIYAGSSPGGYDIYSGNPIYGVTSLTLSGFPTDGRTVYVRLWSRNGDAPWQYNDYTYTASAPVAATPASPASGLQLAGSKVSFGRNPEQQLQRRYVLPDRTDGASMRDRYSTFEGSFMFGVAAASLIAPVTHPRIT